MKEEGGDRGGRSGAASEPQPAHPAYPAPSPAGVPVSHCRPDVPMALGAHGGAWGAGDGGATRAALARTGWRRESAAKQQQP